MNKSKNKTVNYVDKKEFYDLLVKHKQRVMLAEERGLDPPQACDQIGLNIMKIANGLASRYNFSRYPYREEMVSDGIIDACAAINKFDTDRHDNPFGYFTTVIWNSFIHRIESEEVQTYIRFKKTENSYLTGLLVGGEDVEAFSGVIEDNDYRDEFIANYERKVAERKERREQRKLERLAEQEPNQFVNLFDYERDDE